MSTIDLGRGRSWGISHGPGSWLSDEIIFFFPWSITMLGIEGHAYVCAGRYVLIRWFWQHGHMTLVTPCSLPAVNEISHCGPFPYHYSSSFRFSCNQGCSVNMKTVEWPSKLARWRSLESLMKCILSNSLISAGLWEIKEGLMPRFGIKQHNGAAEA